MKRKQASSFALTELLLAGVILIIALGGLLHLFNYCLDLSMLSSGIVTATAEAYSKLEEIRLHEYNDIVSDYDASNFALQQLTGNGIVSASYVPGTGVDLLQATVTVNYTQKSNRVISFTLTTLIAERF